MTEHSQTATSHAFAGIPTTRKSLQMTQDVIKKHEAMKKEFSERVQQYATAFAALRSRYDQVSTSHEALKAEHASLQMEFKKAIEQIRSLTAEVQNLESHLQMFSSELMSSDSFFLDSDNILAGVFNMDTNVEKQTKPSLSVDLSHALSAYAKPEIVASVTESVKETAIMPVAQPLETAPVVDEEIALETASTSDEEAPASLLDDFEFDTDAIMNEINSLEAELEQPVEQAA